LQNKEAVGFLYYLTDLSFDELIAMSVGKQDKKEAKK